MKLTTPPLAHTRRQHSPRVLLFAVCLSLGISAAGSARAAVTITGNSTFNVPTNDYTYTYSVMNSGPEDLVLVTIPAFTPLGVNATASPTGFWQTFDPSQMVVNFMEDGSIVTPQTFSSGSTIGTFSFNTAVGPGPVNFFAYDAAGTEFTGTVVSPVPEPAAALLGSLAAAAVIFRRRRA